MKYETREKALLVKLVSGYMANMVFVPSSFPPYTSSPRLPRESLSISAHKTVNTLWDFADEKRSLR